MVSALLLSMGGYAENVSSHRHEIRVGWGDFMFESLAFHANRQTDNYLYTGHLFLEYVYHFNHWFAMGAQLDDSYFQWKQKRDEMGQMLEVPQPYWCSNISILVPFRFTYYRSQWVSLYSGISVGMNINTGNELNYKEQLTAVAPCVGLTLLACRVGNERVFGTVELGGLNSLNNMHEIYMLGARMFSASIGVRF